MEVLEQILLIPADKRTDAQREYLKLHRSELTPKQLESVITEESGEQTEDEVIDSSPLAKNIGSKMQMEFSTTIKANSDGTLRAIVNSGKEDRHGEILSIKGLDIKKYMTNPILADGHDYSKPSVGITKKLTKTADGQLIADFKFATDIENYDQPKILDQLYRKGYQFAFSIGFIPGEVDKNTYVKSEMVEFSPVLIGADANALLTAKGLAKLGIDKKFLKPYNMYSMLELDKILEKVTSDGVDSLTLGEISFIKEHMQELTKKQIKVLAPIFTDDEEEKETEKETETEANETVTNALDEKIKELTQKIETLENRSPIIVKNISGQAGSEFNLNKNTETTKEKKFLLYARGLQSGNFKEYLDVVGKDAMNTAGNTNVVVPPVEFMAEIQRLEEQYGAARPYVDVKKSTSGAGVKYILGDSDLNIYDTAEGGVKKSTKNTYQEKLLGWRKFAGILPITDELSDDSAVDLWADATNRFARAYAKQEDTLVFLEKKTSGNVNDGIVNAPGTSVIHTDGASVQSVKWENLVDMIYSVPSPSGDTGRFFLNREMLSIVMKLHDSNNRPIWLPGYGDASNGAPATILGRPYTFTLVLPNIAADTDDLPFMVYGDLRFVTVGERTQLELKMFDTGVVGDPDEVDQSVSPLNLMTQDIQALRAVKRTNSVVRFPKAFSVLITSTHS